MRLTKQVKESIVGAALAKAGILELRDTLRLKRAEWVERVRVESFGGPAGAAKVDAAIAQIKAIVQTLPEGVTSSALPVRIESSMYVNCGGISLRPRFNGLLSYVGGIPSVCKPCMDCTLKADHPLVAEFHALEREATELSSKVELITANVCAVLEGVHTDTALLKVWPEAAELLPTATTTPAKAPAVLTSDLNKLINLPSKD